MGSVVQTAANLSPAAILAKSAGIDPTTAANNAGASFGINGLAKPQLANVQQGTSVQDVKAAQQATGNSLQSQQALLSALQGQNGLGQQNALAGQLAAANGVGAQSQALQGLQGAAGQYQNIALGRGPNPAQAMLNQATGQNVANQAALMAGQRGAGANVGLLERQAGQQGAALQQQAVGQGAIMQANQQIAGLQGLTGAEQAAGGLGANLTAAQQGLANQVAGQQIGQTNANVQANLANQGQMQSALQGVNQANISNQGSVNAANAGIAQQQMKGQQQIIGGIGQGAGSFLGMADGGEVKDTSDSIGYAPSNVANPGPQSMFGKFLVSQDQTNNSPLFAESTTSMQPASHDDDSSFSKGNGPGIMNAVSGVAMASKGGLASKGGKVDARKSSQKAVKKGDSYDNDKVPAMLSEGEIVIPRHIAMGKNPIKGSAEFVRQVLAKRKAKS